MIHQFKLCPTCKEPLDIFNNEYIHPDKPCAENHHWYVVDFTIYDDFFHKQWLEKVGSPNQTYNDIICGLNIAILDLQNKEKVLTDLKSDKSFLWGLIWLIRNHLSNLYNRIYRFVYTE